MQSTAVFFNIFLLCKKGNIFCCSVRPVNERQNKLSIFKFRLQVFSAYKARFININKTSLEKIFLRFIQNLNNLIQFRLFFYKCSIVILFLLFLFQKIIKKKSASKQTVSQSASHRQFIFIGILIPINFN